MKKKIALAIYPNFSMQEIANLCSLFRWNYDSETVVFASAMEPVNAEEGPLFQPHMTFDDFNKEDYDCLILSGCSDFSKAISDIKLKSFLAQFKGTDYPIGAICSGPLFLAQAGLLEGRKFTNSLYVQMNEMLPFIEMENLLYEPLVIDGPYITATGFAFNEFAIAMARKLGYECKDKIFSGVPAVYDINSYKQYLGEEDLPELKSMIKDFV